MAAGDLGGADGADAGFTIHSDNAMFGVDYPHPESIFPNAMDTRLLAAMPHVTEADARKVLYENAAEVYHLDLAALQPNFDESASSSTRSPRSRSPRSEWPRSRPGAPSSGGVDLGEGRERLDRVAQHVERHLRADRQRGLLEPLAGLRPERVRAGEPLAVAEERQEAVRLGVGAGVGGGLRDAGDRRASA